MIAAQPVESRWEDPPMESRRLEVCRRDVLVSAGRVVIRAAEIAHLPENLWRNYLADARLVGRAVRGAVIARRAGEELPVEPAVGRLIVTIEFDGPQILAIEEEVAEVVHATRLQMVGARNLPPAKQPA